MTKLFFAIIALLPTLAFALSATPVQVGHGHASNGVCAVTLSKSVAANDSIIAFAGITNSIALGSGGVTDNLNTITAARAWTQNATPSASFGMYWVQTALPGSHTITFNLASSANITCFASEYPPLILDTAATIKFVLTTTAIASNAITPAANGELLVFGFVQGGASITYSSYNSSFVQQDNQNAAGPSGAWASETISCSGSCASTSGSATASTAGTFGAILAAFVAAGPPASQFFFARNRLPSKTALDPRAAASHHVSGRTGRT